MKTGEFVSVVGSNGSGKTTLLNLISGSIPVDSGKVILDGVDMTKLPEYKRAKKIGRVFQDPAVGTVPYMTITENLFLAANKGKPLSREELLERVWGYNGFYGDIRTVDVTVSRLREKLERDPAKPEYLMTKRGVGYYIAE